MTECRPDCGQCCDPVAMAYSVMDAQTGKPMPDEQREWILKVGRPLTRREGLRRSPWMGQGGRTYCQDDAGAIVIVWTHFYECSWYDPDRRVCTHYDERPDFCRGFPWFGQGPDTRKALPGACSFRADIGEPVDPVPVHLGPAR